MALAARARLETGAIRSLGWGTRRRLSAPRCDGCGRAGEPVAGGPWRVSVFCCPARESGGESAPPTAGAEVLIFGAKPFLEQSGEPARF